MLVEDAVDRRHSTTEFSTRYILTEQLNRIISESLKIPSFNNRYNFKIAILTHDSEKKARIGRRLSSYAKKEKDPIAETQAYCIKKASSLILIYKDLSKTDIEEDNDFITVGALGENICLIATNYYLGTLWIDRIKYIDDKINKILPNYKDMELCYGIVLGYRDSRYSYKRDQAPESQVDWFVG